MLSPSGIRPPDGHKIQTVEVAKGLYVATNAYEGTYDYFSDEPAQVTDGVVSDQRAGNDKRTIETAG